MRPSPTEPGMLKMGEPKVTAPEPVRSPCKRNRISWSLPPASSQTKRCSLSSHSIQAGEVGRPSVRSRGTPPRAGTIQTSPPVEPWSLIKPPMKAMVLPSGDQRGTAICRPCKGPDTSAGARIGIGFRSELLGVEPGHPPVVLARRRGGDVGQRLRIRRPVELVDVQVGRCRQGRRDWSGAADAATATRWISTPSSPMTPEGGFMAASAPAARVAPST